MRSQGLEPWTSFYQWSKCCVLEIVAMVVGTACSRMNCRAHQYFTSPPHTRKALDGHKCCMPKSTSMTRQLSAGQLSADN
uniref:Secreted protein n=1 Tax=Romanomermis culicivorax TaxID=13658 RepID=A0A915J2C1_ROMCU